MKHQIARRRTFAIISHPDAGKTTLTEKLLLYGGVIQLAGAVKAKRGRASAVSDWMEMERERGISITTSVLQFPYRGLQMNLLDTPGHADFSEDTYRTLHAVDGAVMLLDSAKGVEAQTRKLFRVCRQRSIPIFTFVNKLDRPGRDAFDLIGEVESVLGIGVYPVTWPIFRGGIFRGVYHRLRQRVYLFDADRANSSSTTGAERPPVEVTGIDDPALREELDDGRLRPAPPRRRAARDGRRRLRPGALRGRAALAHVLRTARSTTSAWRPSSRPSPSSCRRRGRARPTPAPSSPPGRSSAASSSRSRRTWTRPTATAWPSCASAPAGWCAA